MPEDDAADEPVELRLLIDLPDGRQELLTPRGRDLLVGRDPDCDVIAPAAQSWRVSRRHLRLELTPDGWWAEDLASTNGSWINRLRLRGRRRLRSGDYLILGGQFRSGGFAFTVEIGSGRGHAAP